jgi:hypothetical protein
MKRPILSILVAVLAAFAAGRAMAIPVDGNECAGQGGFDRCTFQGSPSIAKFERIEIIDENPFVGLRSEGNMTTWPTLDVLDQDVPGTTGVNIIIGEFTLNVSADLTTIAWSYAKNAPGDPNIVWVILSAGGDGEATNVAGMTSGTVTTVGLLQGRDFSHITFFDTSNGVPPAEMPEPSALLLLGGGLAALGLMRRRRS